MGIAERQAKERKQRENLILDAATKVILEKGIENATMEDIASAAELGKATLYNYFTSKEILLIGIELRGTLIEEKGFKTAYKEGKNGLDRTLKICRYYFDYCLEYPVNFHAKVHKGRADKRTHSLVKDDPIMIKYFKAIMRIHQILSDAIADGIEDGTIRSNLNPQRTSLLLWCQSNGIIEIILNNGQILEDVQGITINELSEDFFYAIEQQLSANISVSEQTKRKKMQ